MDGYLQCCHFLRVLAQPLRFCDHFADTKIIYIYIFLRCQKTHGSNIYIHILGHFD